MSKLRNLLRHKHIIYQLYHHLELLNLEPIDDSLASYLPPSAPSLLSRSVLRCCVFVPSFIHSFVVLPLCLLPLISPSLPPLPPCLARPYGAIGYKKQKIALGADSLTDRKALFLEKLGLRCC